jgi:uncharacterized protein (DUF488 family)
MAHVIYTIGHSTHTETCFVELLRLHEVTAVADVRSRPYSRFNPQFDRETLKGTLKAAGIQYAFLGGELGARSDTPSCYENGKVRYDRLAETEAFREGLDRVERGSLQFRIALMCAEKEPMECHRSILVARHLCLRGAEVRHILEDGRTETQTELISRVAKTLHMREGEQPMFRTQEDFVGDVYRKQEARIAYELVGEKDASAA